MQEGRTGRTAKGHFDLVRNTRPIYWFIENVRNLATKSKDTGLSNLDVVIEMSNALGYFVRDTFLEADSYGLPQNRGRYYIVAFLISAEPFDQTDDNFEVPAWVDSFDVLMTSMQIEPLPWSDILLPDTDPRAEAANFAPVDADGDKRSAKKPRKQNKASDGTTKD
jgi:site-specific DNA-cytosine methylase